MRTHGFINRLITFSKNRAHSFINETPGEFASFILVGVYMQPQASANEAQRVLALGQTLTKAITLKNSPNTDNSSNVLPEKGTLWITATLQSESESEWNLLAMKVCTDKEYYISILSILSILKSNYN